MASTAANGARWPACGLAERRARLRARGQARRDVGDLVGQLARLARARRARAALARERDGAVAQIARRRCDRRDPRRGRLLAEIGLPSVHISSASAAPASRGSRCVPPAPGMMPEQHFGLADLRVAAAATR